MKDDAQEPAGPDRTESQQEQPPTDGADNLQKQLEECRAQSERYLDQTRRSMAEFANFRKRVEREQAEAARSRNADLIKRLLPLIDDLDRAFENLPAEMKGQPWVDGVQLIQRKMHSVFDLEGVKAIDTTGQEFDPAQHEAVTHEPNEEVPEGHVIGEVRRGYTLNDRVLRPAQVRVSSGRAAN